MRALFHRELSGSNAACALAVEKHVGARGSAIDHDQRVDRSEVKRQGAPAAGGNLHGARVGGESGFADGDRVLSGLNSGETERRDPTWIGAAVKLNLRTGWDGHNLHRPRQSHGTWSAGLSPGRRRTGPLMKLPDRY